MRSESNAIKRVLLWPVLFLIQIVARMPWIVASAFAHVSVFFMWLANRRAWPITETNISICFPDLTRERQHSLIKASLYETSMNAIDMTRCFEAIDRYGLTKDDMYVPAPMR